MATTNVVSKSLYDGSVEILFYPDSHRYKYEGSWLPGVTTITKPLGGSEGIKWWEKDIAVREVISMIPDEECRAQIHSFLSEYEKDKDLRSPAFKEFQRRYQWAYKADLDAAADVGRIVHAYAEQYAKALLHDAEKPAMPKHPEAVKGVEAFHQWLDAHHVVFIDTERVCFSKKYLYAGTVDAVAQVDGILTVLDYKTGKDVYLGYWAQLAAYRGALEEELALGAQQTCVMRFDKVTGAFDPRLATNPDSDWNAFVNALYLYRWEQQKKEEDKRRKQEAF